MSKIFEDDPLNSEPSDDAEPDLSVLENNPEGPVILETSESHMAPAKDEAEIEAFKETISELPNMDVEFKIVDDQTSKIISLKDVEQQVLGEDKVDTHMADIVNESFSDLYESTLSKNSFTKLPTKVNLKEIRQYMRSKIAKEEHILLDLFTAYLADPLKCAQQTVSKISETYLPALIRISESLKSELELHRNKVFNNPNAIVPMKDGTFINLTTVDLISVDESALNTPLTTGPKFQYALEAVRSALACPHTRKFILSTLGYEQTQDQFTMKDLAKFILSDEPINILSQRQPEMMNALAQIEALVSQAGGLAAKPDGVSEFVVQNAKVLLDFNHMLNKDSAMIYHLTILNLAIKQMLLTYLEL